jgi:hypothetical protein
MMIPLLVDYGTNTMVYYDLTKIMGLALLLNTVVLEWYFSIYQLVQDFVATVFGSM